MLRVRTGEVMHLVPARKSGCCYYRVLLPPSYRGEELPFSDGAGDLEMLGRIAERTGHSAASRVKVDYLATGNSFKQLFRCRQESHCFLVTVAMEKNFRRAGTQPQVETRGRFFKEQTCFGNHEGSFTVFAAQERRDILFQG
jgi:hypothetical protein